MQDRPLSRLERRNQRRRTPHFPHWIVLLYLPLALASNWTAWLNGPTHTLTTGAGGDQGQEVWFLGIIAHQLAHFHNPFFTDVINLPVGVNLANVTSMPVLGVLGAPLTWLWGPIFTYNVLTVLSPLTAALALYWVAGRWMQRRSARFVAGLLYGFSPYVVAQLWGHLFLTMIFVFPVMVLALHEMLVHQQWKPWQSGGLFALCLAVEVGISPELLLDACIIAVVPILMLIVRLTRRPRATTLYAARAVGVAVAAAVVPLGLFVTNFLYGEGHITGAYRSASTVANLKVDGLALLLPGSLQKFGFGVANSIDALISFRSVTDIPDPYESGGFIGIPLLILMAFSLPLVRRRRAVWVLGAGAVVSLAVAMGAAPTFNGVGLGFSGPFRQLRQLPLLESSIASRWTLFMWLFLALLIGIMVEGAITYFATKPQSIKRSQRVLAALSLAALAVVTLVPRWPMPQNEQTVPRWFSSPAAKALTAESVVVTSPLAVNGHPLAMLWQAVNDFNFTLAHGSAGPQTATNSALKTIVTQCDVPNAPDEPELSQLGAAQRELQQLGVSTLLATQYSANPVCADHVFRALAGGNGVDELDVRIWRLTR